MYRIIIYLYLDCVVFIVNYVTPYFCRMNSFWTTFFVDFFVAVDFTVSALSWYESGIASYNKDLYTILALLSIFRALFSHVRSCKLFLMLIN